MGGSSGEGGVSQGEQVPHLVFSDYGNRFLFQARGIYIGEGIFVDRPTFHQPVEEPVQAAVLSVYVALGELLRLGVAPLPKPAGAFLEVRKVLLDVLGADLLHIRPALFLGVEGGHGDSAFQAVEVSLGVPV